MRISAAVDSLIPFMKVFLKAIAKAWGKVSRKAIARAWGKVSRKVYEIVEVVPRFNQI